MPNTTSNWPWHALYLLTLAAMAWAIYAAAQRVDYTWHWDRIPQYLVSTQGEEIRAPFDGFVTIAADRRSVTLAELKGDL
jgi:polar amino acid transport system permease protein